MKKWTLITVTYNNEKQLREHWVEVNLSNVCWIVVDNGSTDQTLDLAKALSATVISTGSNLGFSRANNIGLKMADSEFIAFVNPDVTVESEHLAALEEVINKLQGFVSPQLLNKDGTTQPNGRGLPFLVDKFANRGIFFPGSRLDHYLFEPQSEVVLVDWLMGAVVCGKKDYFESVGGWNEEYFLYYEDHEFGIKAWKNGYPVALVPKIQWVHGWERETKFPKFKPWLREIRSAVVFYRKYPELLTHVFSRDRVFLGRKSQNSKNSRGAKNEQS